MKGSHVKLTLNAIGRLLTAGDVRDLAMYFECPLPIYMHDKFFLFDCREKLGEALAVYSADARRANIRRLEPILLRIEDSTANRSMFVVRWNHLLGDGTCSTSNVVRYVGRRGALDGMLRIELVEYLEIGSVEVSQQLLEVVFA